MPDCWSSSLELVVQVPTFGTCLANFGSLFRDKCFLINLKWHWCLLFKMWQQHAEVCLQVIMAISTDKSKGIYLDNNLPMLLITLNHLINVFGWGGLLTSSLQNLLYFNVTFLKHTCVHWYDNESFVLCTSLLCCLLKMHLFLFFMPILD